jgi:hypothetical protein
VGVAREHGVRHVPGELSRTAKLRSHPLCSVSAVPQ